MKTTITLIVVSSMFLFSFNYLKVKESSTDLKEIKIGTQIWSATNLDVSTFRNGDAIHEAKTAEEWKQAGTEKSPAWCYYNNDPANGTKYGKLYNFYAIKDPRGLAPNGWHIPTDAEWTALTDNLGGEKIAGRKMKSTSGWEENGNGTNVSGFAGLAAGCRNLDGTFSYIGTDSYWWSFTEKDAYSAISRNLNYFAASVSKSNNAVRAGLSVRCLKD